MRLIDPLLAEIDQEAVVTRKLLERAPREQVEWQPHPTSMSLGRLAFHVASIPGNIATFLEADTFDMAKIGTGPEPDFDVDWAALLDEKLAHAHAVLDGMENDWAMSTWTATRDGNVLIAVPRLAVVRGFLLNHWIHHRGQLSVYLRMLGVPIPSIYGPSADDNPYA